MLPAHVASVALCAALVLAGAADAAYTLTRARGVFQPNVAGLMFALCVGAGVLTAAGSGLGLAVAVSSPNGAWTLAPVPLLQAAAVVGSSAALFTLLAFVNLSLSLSEMRKVAGSRARVRRAATHQRRRRPGR